MSDYLHFHGFDIPISLVHRTGGTADSFQKVSDWHTAQIERHIGPVRATDNVVEIGCACGRDAIPLVSVLTHGTYLGTDTQKPQIKWCTETITARHPDFTFIHHDIHDTLHNPEGTLHAKDIYLPSADKSVDLILLYSVFTHMMGDEIAHYLREFRRILKPTGRVFATCFLVNQPILDVIRASEKPSWNLRFPHVFGNGYINSDKEPRGAVAFDEDVFFRMVEENGLALEKVLWGQWSSQRQTPSSGQNAVILKAQ
ncbi:MAG: class I SAM-dependent methyltransferase [Rhizobiaceae bacterium]|nr:MAG: class I SAM-dependent methyltransferase [Rhizobiaceae bacterium]CAG0993379.1 hypothetical protein RHIZO_02373 [Rhizobiaceae bacterium]